MRKGLLLATVAGFAAMVGTGSVNAADKLKVGVTATLEGTYTVLGEDGMRGYDLGVEAHGGKAGGKEVETIVGSTDASPDSASARPRSSSSKTRSTFSFRRCRARKVSLSATTRRPSRRLRS